MVDKWELIGRYKKLVGQGKAMPIRCPDDEAIYIYRFGAEETPVLYCYICKTTVIPGLWVYKQIEAAIDDS